MSQIIYQNVGTNLKGPLIFYSMQIVTNYIGKWRCNVQTKATSIRRMTSFLVSLFVGGHLAQYRIHKQKKTSLCSLVVDSGYSFTHIVPYHNGKKVMEGLKRYGGKICWGPCVKINVIMNAIFGVTLLCTTTPQNTCYCLHLIRIRTWHKWLTSRQKD